MLEQERVCKWQDSRFADCECISQGNPVVRQQVEKRTQVTIRTLNHRGGPSKECGLLGRVSATMSVNQSMGSFWWCSMMQYDGKMVHVHTKQAHDSPVCILWLLLPSLCNQKAWARPRLSFQSMHLHYRPQYNQAAIIRWIAVTFSSRKRHRNWQQERKGELSAFQKNNSVVYTEHQSFLAHLSQQWKDSSFMKINITLKGKCNCAHVRTQMKPYWNIAKLVMSSWNWISGLDNHIHGRRGKSRRIDSIVQSMTIIWKNLRFS